MDSEIFLYSKICDLSIIKYITYWDNGNNSWDNCYTSGLRHMDNMSSSPGKMHLKSYLTHTHTHIHALQYVSGTLLNHLQIMSPSILIMTLRSLQ